MKTNFVKLAQALVLGGAIAMLAGCKSKDSDPAATGEVEFFATDAPTDDADVKSVFVTITDIKVDGQSVSGFTKQTVDIKAYQDGATKSLGKFKINAKQYSNIQLVLDADIDASGNAPGSYVQTTNDAKFKLKSSGTSTITVNKAWNATANSTSNVIIDFDLRKSIKRVSDESVRYTFASDAELASAIHVNNLEKTGMLSGTYTEQTTSNSDKVIVYAYKKGTFNATTESVTDDSGMSFKNATASTVVKGSGSAKTYTLAFLEDGEYELHFASYNEDESDHFNFVSMLSTETSLNGTMGDSVSIQLGTTLNLVTVYSGL